MSAVVPRRAFLSGLVGLPLVGGAVGLIGQPTAAATPVTRTLLAQYWNWLFYERRILCHEMARGDERERHWLEHSCGGPVRVLSQPEEDELIWISGRTWPADPADTRGAYLPDFHFPRFGQWTDVPPPSSRAAVVMGAADFDWRPVPYR